MAGQGQCIRWTAAGLMACGLAAAQGAASREARAAWLIGQFRSAPIGPNAKFGAAAALARLALNPGDAEVVDRITRFYDRVPAGSNGQQFSYPGVAWVLGKHWDRFAPVQRDHLKARLKGFDDLLGHGTENHAIMKGVAAYLFAQYWPDETGWLRGTHTSAQLGEAARRNLLAVMRSLYDRGYEENLSTTYAAVHLFPYYALYDCAADPEVKAAADAALHFHVANLAANHLEGVVIPPYNRQNAWQQNTYRSGSGHVPALQWIHWLYWAEAQNRTPVGEELVRVGENQYVVYAAVSEWTPPAAIDSLARGDTAPYELAASAPSFGHNSRMSGSPGFWGTGTPGECVRTIYRDRLYAVGSGCFQYYPDEFYVDYNGFGIVYKSPDAYNYIECHHPYWRSNDRAWKGLNSPFMQTAQYRGTAIALFHIPAADPWIGRGRSDWQALRDSHSRSLLQEALVRYPKSIDQKVEERGWIFLREGDVYIAILPLKAYTIDRDDPQAGEFHLVRSAFAQTGFVFDLATKRDFATFGAFQAAVNQNPPVVDWGRFSVTYTNVRGDTLAATWNPPTYDVPKGERATVRPHVAVNGASVPMDTTYPVLQSPSVELIDRVLRVSTPGGRIEVDWRGEVPAFRNP